MDISYSIPVPNYHARMADYYDVYKSDEVLLSFPQLTTSST